MLALEFFRSVPRYLAGRALGAKAPGAFAGQVAPLRLVERPDPAPRGDGWARVKPRLSGICGSDLNTVSGGASFYFSALVSTPFVPGHEVVGELKDDVDGLTAGTRVVIDPVLACAARGVEPQCDACARGEPGLCERVTGGHLSAGLQTGYCRDASGGWAQWMTAHQSQLHPVPDDVADEAAVMIEPMACAIHAVRRARVPADATLLVVGAGTVGLLTVIALRAFAEPGRVLVVAKHEQQAALARRFGATDIFPPDGALGAVRRATRAFRADPERSSPFLLGGVDVAFECAGSADALDLALRATRGRGRVVLTGMPAGADLSPAWFRELEVVGAYSGAGAFDDAVALAASGALAGLVSATYPLARWRDALDAALYAGRQGSVKVAFDPRLDQR